MHQDSMHFRPVRWRREVNLELPCSLSPGRHFAHVDFVPLELIQPNQYFSALHCKHDPFALGQQHPSIHAWREASSEEALSLCL
jgi:hypothetical protein